ncbi:F-box/FBD/LRR-repeat protein At1g78750-like [Vicia villosa]|uniref:F-box/FBD/LRR-repeat protein At1g78750-like n=1 Tax=Vicia villosa TaxID=3911 RepID=UPI00273B8D94|nr:F-box/FBD/LRR-repeat protein At1g78750-like [Vicia villosa]
MSNSEDDTMIPPATKKVKLNNSDELILDMLSELPDCVILHILSFLNTKDAVQTCILSVRWKDLWKHLPALIFHKSNFRTHKIFTKFVSTVLSLRDSSLALHTLDFNQGNSRLEPRVLKRIVNYAISHNVQHLGLSVTSSIAQIPLTLFSSHTLTHLNLFISTHDDIAQMSLNLPSLTYLKLSVYSGHENVFPKSLILPALTSLQLGNFAFCVGDNGCAEPFSIFDRLNSLLICGCTVKDTTTLCISSATLVTFTMYSHSYDNFYKIDLCTPSLSTFAFCGTPYQEIRGSNISSLKHVDIHSDALSNDRWPPFFLLSWLIEFTNIISLTITATSLQVLNLIPRLFKYNFPSLGKLKSLNVEIDEIQYGFRMTLCDVKLLSVKSKKKAARIRKAFSLGSEPSPAVPDGITDFLLQNSPSAEVVFIDCTKKPLRPRYL